MKRVMVGMRFERVGVLFIAALLGGCATLPSSGPTAAQIRNAQGKAGAVQFAIVDVDTALRERADLTREIPQAPSAGLSTLAATGSVDRIGPGDVLDISIYEVGVSLFSGGASTPDMASFDPSAKRIGLAAMVTEDGTIKLPYIGVLNVQGKTTVDVQRAIERGLSDKSQAPQALVTVRENNSNVFYVSGDVAKPGRQTLTLARQRILDSIADAGGARTATADTIVRFNRNGKVVEQRLASIRPGGPDDLVLLPGDRIELQNLPRTYTVFGAINKVSQVPFGSENVSLAEAVARVGGPNDASADPSAVYVFRFEPDPQHPAQERPIIYRLNMLSPASYFVGQKFAMRDKDVIYVATAASHQPSKLVQIINQLFTPLILARQLTR